MAQYDGFVKSTDNSYFEEEKMKSKKQEVSDRIPKIRNFSTGATRDSDDDKLDYEGFLSPLVLERYAQYMHAHRKQLNGNVTHVRDSDNWQKGIPIAQYVKSLFRHFMDIWKINRGLGPIYDRKDGHVVLADEALCAIIFNASGHLHELLKKKDDNSKIIGISKAAVDAFYGDFQ